MNKTVYKALLPVNHDNEPYEIGDSISLTQKQADALKLVNAIEDVEQADPPAGTASGESTASADALAEQTDKDTNLDPLSNKDGGDATPTADSAAAGEPLTPGASAPGAEELLTPASADAVQDLADPAPAVVSTAGGDGQTILDPAATPLDGAVTGGAASPVIAEAPVQADQAPADPAQADPAQADPAQADQASSEAPKKTRKAKAAD